MISRRSFFAALAAIGAGGATVAAAAPAIAPAVASKGLELITVYCPRCSWIIHPSHLGRTPPYVTPAMIAPVAVVCPNPHCGHAYTATFVREVG